METRKIQQVGGGTYTVSLPKDWAEAEGAIAGEVVHLHTHIDGVLVIQPQDRREDPPGWVSIHVSHEDPVHLHQLLRAAYASGVKEVTFVTSDAFSDDQRRVLECVSRNLPGATVLEDGPSRVTVRTMLDSDEVSIRQSVRQLQFVALSMHRDATDALTDEVSRDGLPELDDRADRLYAMIDRHVARGLSRLDEVDALGLNRSELFELWEVARELERVADHAENIGAIVAETDDPVAAASADDIHDLARTAREVVEDAAGVVVGEMDIDTARRALEARDHVREEIEALDRRLFESVQTSYRLTHVLASVRRTAEHGGNIAEVGLRSAFRSGDLAESTSGAGAIDEPEDHTAVNSNK